MTNLADVSPSPSARDWSVLASQVGSELEPDVAEADRSGQISTIAFERLRQEGLTSALVPEDFAGGGASHREMGDILRVLGRHDPAVAVTLSMHSHLLATQLWRHRHGMDATAVFTKVVGGAILISTGASDWVGASGSASKVEGGFRVSARKLPASGCEVGTVLVTSIRWEEPGEGPRVLHCSIPFSSEGVSIEATWDAVGLRASGSHTVILDEVFVPDAAVSLIRPADIWHPIWNVVLGSALPLIMSAYIGFADAAVDLALEHNAGRSGPHVYQLHGEMMNAHLSAVDAVAAMFEESADLNFANTNDMAARMLSRKTVAADSVIQTVRLALEAVGGSGFLRTSSLERLYRDVHGSLFHPLPRAKQTQFSGRVALGLDPLG